KHLRDEQKAATIPPATRFSKGTPSSSDQRAKRSAAALPGSSSKKRMPSSSALPPSSSAFYFYSTPPPLIDLSVGSLRSSSRVWGLYNHLMPSLEKEGASAQAVDILKGALSFEDWRLMSSLSLEDLGRM
ncbi:UNVERIFIED_CONTAM: hypothetical protein Sangu_2628000, partial [Sesamum angustifolium]